MAIYKYRVKDQRGKTLNGVVEAPTESEAVEILRERGFFVLSLATTRLRHPRGLKMNIGLVKQKDLVIFSRQLSVMISATVPIVQALRIVGKQTVNPVFGDKIVEIANDVDGGMKLSEALGKHDKIFSYFFISMVRSGETSGKLDEILEYLADQMEKDYDLINNLKSSMIYPIFVVCGMIGVAFLMMVFVIPKMTQMLKDAGAELPLLTRWLVSASDFMAAYWIYIIIFFAILAFVLRIWMRSKGGKLVMDIVKVKTPVFGSLFRRIYVVRFTRSFATLIKGGVPIARALRVTAEVVDNKAYQELILDTVREVEGGNSVASLFSESDLMPKMLSQMMIIGEQTGKLDVVLDRLSNFYTREVDNAVRGLTSLIEPMILVIMGVGVGGMVAAVMMPMFKLAQSIS